MAPKTRFNDGGPVPGASSPPTDARTYHPHRGMRQIRFPRRRKIVKKYGHHDTTRSPRQQTLTQAGYTMPPRPPGLLEDALDLESMEDDFSDVQTGSGQASTLAVGKISSKRRKVWHREPETVATCGFHTQTLTQFVSKHSASDTNGDDDDDKLQATIRDSEDEDIFASPITLPKRPATPRRVEEKSLPPSSGHVVSGKTKPGEAVSTPTASRIEIPSSQPSPFTPMVLLDRYHSPMDRQRSSPLTDRFKRRSATRRNGTHESFLAASADHKALSRNSQPVCESKEIPDSDEDDVDYSAPFCPRRATKLEHEPAPARAIESGSATDDTGYPIAQPSSSPISPLSDTWPLSLTPSPRLPQAVNAQALIEMPKIAAVASNEVGHRASSQSVEAAQNPAATKAFQTPRRDINAPLHRQELNWQHEAPASANCQISMSPFLKTLESQATQSLYSQNLESQRVSLEAIHMLGPQTDRSDIIISIHPEQIRKIVNGTKDHEFRSFKIPHTVSRFWIYATRPVCELQYMAVIAAGFRQPGEIDSKSGIGNDDFNAGRLVAKFAYKLEQVYQLNNPVSLDVMKRNGWTGPPRRYDYLPPAVVGSLLGNLRCALFEDASEAGLDQPDLKVSGSRDVPSGGTLSSRGSTAGDAGTLTTAQSIAAGTQYPGANVNANEDMSISQEIEAQLLSDISETQISRNLQPSTLLSSQAQTAAHAPSTSHLPWPSQVTTATVLSTQESPGRARSQLHDTESIPDAELVVVLRPELEPEQASVTFTKDGCADRAGLSDANYASQWQNNLQRRHSRARDRRLRPLFQPDMVSSGDSTQAALPDSLYEEVRQAPPAVILDSEDSDDEE